MKLLYTFAVLATVALTSCAKADHMEDFKAFSKICQAEVQVTDVELDKFFKNGMKPADAKEAVKCHIKCVMEKQEFFKNGEFEEMTFVANIPNMPNIKDREAEFTKAAANCKGEKGANDCDTAYKIAMCFKDNKAEFGYKRE